MRCLFRVVLEPPVDLICERTAANNIADRPHVTDLGPWYDVCRPGCCANFRGEKLTIAGADTTVGTGHDPYSSGTAADKASQVEGQGSL